MGKEPTFGEVSTVHERGKERSVVFNELIKNRIEMSVLFLNY